MATKKAAAKKAPGKVKKQVVEVPKPCPFCGSAPVGPKPTGAQFHSVGCWDKDCPVKPGVADATPEGAVRRWNTRA